LFQENARADCVQARVGLSKTGVEGAMRLAVAILHPRPFTAVAFCDPAIVIAEAVDK